MGGTVTLKRLIFPTAFVCFVVTFSMVCASQPDSHGETPPADAGKSLQLLKEGNRRFLEEKSVHPDTGLARLTQTATEGQHPFATILACSDSRVPLELLFDQGFGDLFCVRVAGNICSDDEMGSIEYGVEHLGTPLLVVLGHTKCGAVTAAVKHDHAEGHIQTLIRQIGPAVERAQKANPESSEDELVGVTVKENVFLAVETLLKQSDSIREAVREKKLVIIAAIYDISNGQVEWLGEHPDQEKLCQHETAPKVQAVPVLKTPANRPFRGRIFKN